MYGRNHYFLLRELHKGSTFSPEVSSSGFIRTLWCCPDLLQSSAEIRPENIPQFCFFFSLSFLKLGAKGAASLLLFPCQPNCHVVYLWLIPVWGGSGFNNAVCPQSKQEQVVVCGSTSDCASLWLLIMLCLLGVLRHFGIHNVCGHQQNTRT